MYEKIFQINRVRRQNIYDFLNLIIFSRFLYVMPRREKSSTHLLGRFPTTILDLYENRKSLICQNFIHEQRSVTEIEEIRIFWPKIFSSIIQMKKFLVLENIFH